VSVSNSWHALLLSLAVLVALWIAFLVFLVITRPDTGALRDLPRMLPDTLRLVGRLAKDQSIARSARLPVLALLGYLAAPIDLVPDFIPVIGYTDDAILTALVLRHLVRKAGPEKLVEHWPGTPEGLVTLTRMLRLGPN
jgi:uncharacterized membrane protein YkvA (DUF1232 family)